MRVGSREGERRGAEGSLERPAEGRRGFPRWLLAVSFASVTDGDDIHHLLDIIDGDEGVRVGRIIGT